MLLMMIFQCAGDETPNAIDEPPRLLSAAHWFGTDEVGRESSHKQPRRIKVVAIGKVWIEQNPPARAATARDARPVATAHRGSVRAVDFAGADNGSWQPPLRAEFV